MNHSCISLLYHTNMDRHNIRPEAEEDVRKRSPPSSFQPVFQQQEDMTKKSQHADYEAIFDSGYSTGMPSSSNIDYSSQSSVQQHPSKTSSQDDLKECMIDVPTSDSGLCLDSKCDLSSKLVLDNQEAEPSQFPSNESRSLSLPPGIDLDVIGSEALLPNSEGNSLLHLSIVKSFTDLSLKLIQKALHPDLLDIRNALWQTPMHLAASLGEAVVVRRLLVSGATIDLKNWDGETALHIACNQGDLETVKSILRPISPSEVIEANLDHYMPQIHGSNMITLMHDMNYDGQTCIHLASKTGNCRLLEYLKSIGGNFNVREGKSGWTCLHSAVALFRADIVHMLTTVIGVDVNVRCYSGKTALQTAWSSSKRLSSPAALAAIRSIIILLIEAGANKNEYNTSEDDNSDRSESSDEEDN